MEVPGPIPPSEYRERKMEGVWGEGREEERRKKKNFDFFLAPRSQWAARTKDTNSVILSKIKYIHLSERPGLKILVFSLPIPDESVRTLPLALNRQLFESSCLMI